ncbi:unnamed protein product [Menidia menidia]|uniref:(Atlantic silverside) hypothetical protein n=1 Tax=Menidia menidia TaxID=238744 RepID=A0A8S4BHE1_9TELE|nr:unnamed protein product [Menidia menidia]
MDKEPAENLAESGSTPLNGAATSGEQRRRAPGTRVRTACPQDQGQHHSGSGWWSLCVRKKHLVLGDSNLGRTAPFQRMDAVVASSIFHRGPYRAVLKMARPEASICICPVNVGGHWLLVVVRSDHRNIVVIDPKGRENAYERRLLRNWRNFLKAKKASQRKWREGSLRSVGTGHDELLEARLAIVTTLLPHKGGRLLRLLLLPHLYFHCLSGC